MATVQEGLQSQIKNIEKTYGKKLPEWLKIIKASGLTKHTDVVKMLKTKYGMTHGNAHRLSLISRGSDATTKNKVALKQGSDPINNLFKGPKLELKPMYDKIVKYVESLGKDIELAPKSSYVSLRRKKQFAMIQPSTKSRIDLGLILKGRPFTKRLENAKTFNALFTHRIRIGNLKEIDKEVLDLLKQAYSEAH